MLTKFRDRHLKKILWSLLFIIVPAFILWGGISSLRGRKQSLIGTIGNEKITTQKLNHYIQMAQVYLVLYGKKQTRPDYNTLNNLAFEFMILLWKADQDKIRVGDAEVVDYLNNHILGQKEAATAVYKHLLETVRRRYNLSLTPRNFEEYIRDFLKIDKLFEKYITVNISEEEIKEAYRLDTQKAKINYLFIPDAEFEVDPGINDSEIKSFYENNKPLFEEPTRVDINYIIVNDGKTLNEIDFKSVSGLADLAVKLSLPVKAAGPLTLADPIQEIGWEPRINELAFSLNEGEMSPPLKTKNGLVIIEKRKTLPARTPVLSEIKTKVKTALLTERAQAAAKSHTTELLKEIKNRHIQNLNTLANSKEVLLKTTDYFKYTDYIEGLGLNPDLNRVIFSLKKGEIYSQPVLLSDGFGIIQLDDLTPFDEQGFQEEKEKYRQMILGNKQVLARFELLTRLAEEANLTLYQ